ncbi:MAG: DinB family protein [Acidobacteriota bacterium]
MNWTQLLQAEVELTYKTTAKLMDQVDPGCLDWKPASGNNWMTTGQLLLHLGSGSGMACKGFVTGDWGLPEGVKFEDIPPEDMLPPADKLPTVASVEEAKKALEADKAVALEAIAQAGEERLANEEAAAPWEPGVKFALGRQLLHMIQHMDRHKSQLFYYLKLQGKPVSTPDLWG